MDYLAAAVIVFEMEGEDDAKDDEVQ